MSFRCIKLNVAWEPIEILEWHDIFDLVYIPDRVKADIHWTYPDEYKIRSQYCSWNYPSIIVLRNHVKRRPERNVNPSVKAILMRDMYTCQYCGEKLTNANGTRDHVIPKSKGGKNSWANLVACCKRCQEKKADRHPSECNMFPTNTPKAPLLSERFKHSVKVASSFERNNWKIGLRKLGLEHLLVGE